MAFLDPETYQNLSFVEDSKNTRPSYNFNPKKELRGDYTLDDLENNEEFSNTASRFLQSIGKDDDTVENLYAYMRDADYNLASATSRAFKELPNLTDQQKEDYTYLRRKFDNADTGGLKQWLRASTDIGFDLVTDPTMILSALMVPFTGGASIGTRVAAGEAAKAGLKAVGKSLVPTKPTTQVLRDRNLLNVRGGIKQLKKERQQVTKDFYRSEVKKNALLGATEGAVFSGVSDYLRQEQDDIDGINLRHGLDFYDIGISTALGAVAGGVLAGGASKLSQAANLEVQRTMHKFTDETILDESDKIYGIKRGYDRVIAATIGKPTTRFIELSKKSPRLRSLLENFRYDTFKGQTERFWGVDEDQLKLYREEGKTTRSYKQIHDNYAGRYNLALEDAVRPLLKKGKLTAEDNDVLDRMMRDKEVLNILVDPKRIERESLRDYETRLLKARKNQTSKVIDLYDDRISADHVNAIRASRRLTDNVLKDAANVQIYRRKLRRGPNAWFTRRWNWDVIKENRTELADIMVRQNAVALPDEVILANLAESQQKEFQSLLDAEILYKDLIDNFETYPLSVVKERLDTLGVGFKPDYQKLDNTPEALYDVFDSIQERKNSFAFKVPDSPTIRREKLKVANNIIDGMLDKRNVVNDINSEVNTTKAPSSFSARNLYMLNDKSISKFLDHDFTSLMRDYLNSSARIIARKQIFGADSEEFSRRHLDVIRKELQDAGGTLTEKDRKGLVELYEFATGLADTTFDHGFLQGTSDWGKLSQQMAHLPLATISSLTEALIPLTRVGGGAYVKGMAQAIKSWSSDNYSTTINLLQKEHNLTKEEANREMHRVYLGLEQAVAQRIDSLTGEGIQSSAARKIQEKFFKVNFLSQWTRTVQLASFTMGKDLITRNLKTVAELQGKTLSSSEKRKLNIATQELFDLGVNIKHGVSWVNNGAKRYSGRVDRNTNAREWDSFYERNVMEGAARFANEIILDPSKSAVTRPHVQQSKYGTILFQFLGYPTAFTNTVLNNWITQIRRQPVVGTAKVGSTALIMTGVAAGLNSLRDDKFDEKEPDEIVLDAVSRWGGTGFGEYILNAKANAEVGGGMFGTVAKSISGPVVGDAVDAILYRKGIGEVAATNMPFYSALPAEFRNQYIKKPAREVDYNIAVAGGLRQPRKGDGAYTELNRAYSDLSKAYRQPYFEGGLIDRPIARTSENPSSRIDKMTGLPYEFQAGDLLENRQSFRIGGFLRKGIEAYISKTKNKLTREELEADPIYREVAPMLRSMETVDEERILDDVNSGLAIETTPQEQDFYNSLFIQDSKVKEDLYSVTGEGIDSGLYGNRMGTFAGQDLKAKQTSKAAMSKNKIRVNNPLKVENLPAIPFYLTNDKAFISKFKNQKGFENLKADIESKLAGVDKLNFKDSIFDKDIIVNEILTSGNKGLYNLLRQEGYDSIEYFGQELPEPRLLLARVTRSTQEIPQVDTAKGKEGKISSAFISAQEEGSKAELAALFEEAKIKDPRETDISFQIDSDPEQIAPEQVTEIPTVIKGFEVQYGVAEQTVDPKVRKNKQYLVFDNDQVLPFGRTEQPTKKEIEYVNSLPVNERKDFIENNNVFNLNVPYIRSLLEEQGIFNLVSTSTKDSIGSVVTYRELTPTLIDRLRNQTDEKSSIMLDNFQKLLIQAENDRRKGFKIGTKDKIERYILPETYYIKVEIEPGKEFVSLFGSPLSLGQALSDIKMSDQTLFHPYGNNVLSDSARKWRLLNIDAEDLQGNVELPDAFVKTEKGKLLSVLQTKRGIQYKGKIDKDLESQKETVATQEFFNPTGADEPTTLKEGSTVEERSFANRFSKGVTSKQRFDLEETKRFYEKNPEFLDEDNFTAQQPETYVETTPPKSKIILPSTVPEDQQVSIKPFKYVEGGKAWAHYSKSDKTIYIDEAELEKRYEAKAWLNPKVEGVDPLPEDAINSLEEWKNFVYAHERSHTINLRREKESLADYENRTNQIALADLMYQKEMTKRNKESKSLLDQDDE